jgi:outer membrane protein TolC
MDCLNIMTKYLSRKFFLTCFSIFISQLLFAQQNDSLLQVATLQNCIQYALAHNPDINNAKVNEDITETMIKGKLSDWYPQINFSYNLQHNFQLPTFNFNGNLARSGTVNTSGLDFGATQNIFNRDVILASKSANDVRLSASQNTAGQKINLTVAVSKAFYNLILTMQQLKVAEEDIVRNTQSVKDATYQYQAGIVDKTDYKQATIALNNSKAEQRTAEEAIIAKAAYLKDLMGYPDAAELTPAFDSAKMEQEIYLDTLQQIDYANRIEIQQLQTQKKLQQYNLQYYKLGYLPDLYAFGNYNMNYLNNEASKLYNTTYPNSFIGLTLSLPLFQGGKRIQQVKQAQLEITQVDNNIQSQENVINSQFQIAMSTYKSELYNYYSLKENLSLANEVYDVIQLQYRSGVKAFLDVITAEVALRSAQINYLNALYQVLSSKIDVVQALGKISY